MSWFKHSPPKHPPIKDRTPPHRTSPSANRAMEETKKTVREKRKSRDKKV